MASLLGPSYYLGWLLEGVIYRAKTTWLHQLDHDFFKPWMFDEKCSEEYHVIKLQMLNVCLETEGEDKF